MRTVLVLCAFAFVVIPQEDERVVRLPARLPASLVLREDGPQTYAFTCDYVQTDSDGAFAGKQRIRATYVRDPDSKRVRWSDVRIAAAKDLDQDFDDGEPQAYMEGFTYDPSRTFELFLPGFFRDFPATQASTFAKNLVWDTSMLEDFGRGHFGELELNVAFAPPAALIRYEAFFNRFEMKVAAVGYAGSSHYWGIVSVSLTDKQIEHATLNELVAMRITAEGRDPRRYSVLRRGELTRD